MEANCEVLRRAKLSLQQEELLQNNETLRGQFEELLKRQQKLMDQNNSLSLKYEICLRENRKLERSHQQDQEEESVYRTNTALLRDKDRLQRTVEAQQEKIKNLEEECRSGRFSMYDGWFENAFFSVSEPQSDEEAAVRRPEVTFSEETVQKTYSLSRNVKKLMSATKKKSLEVLQRPENVQQNVQQRTENSRPGCSHMNQDSWTG